MNLRKLNSNAYLIKGIYDWCIDSEYTPYISAEPNADIKIPLPNSPTTLDPENLLVLNVSPEAAQGIIINDDGVSFMARFNGKATNMFLSINSIKGIYSKETGEGIFLNNKQHFEANKDNLFAPKISKKPIKKIKPQLRLV